MKRELEIIPAILENSFSKIKNKIKILENNFIQKDRNFFIQVDICDGNLTPQKTFLSNLRKDSGIKLKNISKNFFLELDLIIDFKKKDIISKLETLKEIKATRIIFHNSGMNQES
jgi:pentose-5-phosphate-3-epimerase